MAKNKEEKGTQAVFSFLDNQEDPSLVYFELKPYIQPFEQILARAELAGLLQDIKIEEPLGQPAKEQESFSTQVSIDFLRCRLAYWQKVGKSNLELTYQVMYEASCNNHTIPKSRKLRYGPHDLHEYRGKFFPQLVRSLVNFSGIPEGSIVIDPFCGSGTTNCESRLLGMKTIGLDLNPLSVLIAKLKTEILETNPEILLQEAQQVLEHFNPGSKAQLELLWSNEDLQYLRRWFDETALYEVTQILEHLNREESLSKRKFFKICLSNIIRNVSWQKETDLRVRKEKKEYSQGTAFILLKDEISRQLEKLRSYLSLIQKLNVPFSLPVFDIREGDARQIDEIFKNEIGECSLLITSPPYATALPYIDTDRLSLIILGLLPRKEHRQKEYMMIGNREIMESQRQSLWKIYQERRSDLPESICRFIDDLGVQHHSDKVGFRRRNLPALLAKYFLDMGDAMRSAKKMMRPESYAFYVVGNNSTQVDGNRVEIATDKFLWEIGKYVGWSQEEIVDMELLPSRDIFCKNQLTSEKILVFTSTPKRISIYSSWEHDKFEKDTSEWDFEGEDTKEHLHALHPYPARFIPQIPKKAILMYSKSGEVVLDPFCGCGTTLLESILLGRQAIGVDNNEVAYLVTKAKINLYSHQDLVILYKFAKEVEDVLQHSDNHVWKPDYENFTSWFDEQSICDLGKLKWAIEQIPEPARLLALAVFSSIIIRASNQHSDTKYARIKKTYIQGSAVKWFQSKLAESLNRLSEIVDKPKATAQVYLGDCRCLNFIQDNSVHFIVTSPPYLNAYDYHKYHRHRLQWISGNVELARNKEIGCHDVFSRPKAKPDLYFEDMAKCFSEWHRVLYSGRNALIVIGDAIVSGKPVPVADRFIEIMNSIGFVLEKHWIRHLEKSKKSFNPLSRIDKEHVILFQKN